jgi:hypothetical protein
MNRTGTLIASVIGAPLGLGLLLALGIAVTVAAGYLVYGTGLLALEVVKATYAGLRRLRDDCDDGKTYGTRLRALACAGLVSTLAACGGGGGSTATPPPAPVAPAPAPAPITSNLVTTPPPAPAYTGTQASYQVSALVELNRIRGLVGAGYLTRNAALDTSAQAFATYSQLNPSVQGVVEIQGAQGFTGVNPIDRTKAAGYTGLQVAQDATGAYLGGDSTASVDGVLTLGFSDFNLLSPARDVGVGAAPDSVGTGDILVFNFGWGEGAQDAGQHPADLTPLHYPYSGQTGVSRNGSAFQAEGQQGMPIAVWIPTVDVGLVQPGPALVQATLKDSNGNLVPIVVYGAKASTSASLTVVADPTGQLVNSQTLIVPTAELMPNATYTVTIQFAGAAPTTWSFSSGN